MSRNVVLVGSSLLATAVVGGLLVASFWRSHSADGTVATITIANHQIVAPVALSASDQRRGLSGVTTLADDEGMLFVYPTPRLVTFWMHEMLIPIDIIWIREGVVVGLVENAPPPDPGQVPAVFSSPEAITEVLEIQSGLSARLGLSTGTVVQIRREDGI